MGRDWNLIDITGKRFGDLIAIRPIKDKTEINKKWECICECGKTKRIRGGYLRNGKITHCGCKNVDRVHGSFVHGHSRRLYKTKERRAWGNMISRCYNSKSINYGSYGGRGIKVCDEWRRSFVSFLNYVGLCPSKTHSLDRFPNNDGNYEPGNVRWATREEQMNNTSRNAFITHLGETMTKADWAKRIGIPYSCICGRFNLGWSMERIVKTPKNKNLAKRYNKK